MSIARFSVVAVSMARVIFSPTTEPIEPAKYLKSITAAMVGWPFMEKRPVTTASFRPVFSLSVAVFSL